MCEISRDSLVFLLSPILPLFGLLLNLFIFKFNIYYLELSSSKAVIDSKKEGEHLSLIELLEGIKKEEKVISLKEKRKEGPHYFYKIIKL